MTNDMNLFDTEKEATATPKIERTVRLKKLTLENYRNFGYQEIEFDNVSTLLLGRNGLGKTNILEAIFWALNGQLFNGNSKTDRIDIKPIDSEQEIKTRVLLEFEPYYTFEKIFKETYNKQGEYSGTSTTYYINGAVSKTERSTMGNLKEYLGIKDTENQFAKGKLKNLDIIALIYNLNYVNKLDYSLLRELIIDIVGEVDYKAIIKASPDKYKRLYNDLVLNDLGMETLYSQKRIEIFGDTNHKGLNELIELAKGMLNEYQTEANKEIDTKEIETAQLELTKISDEISTLNFKKTQSQDNISKDYDMKISAKDLEISQAQQVIRQSYQEELDKFYNNDLQKQVNAKQLELNGTESKKNNKSREISTTENFISQNGYKITTRSAELERLIASKKTYQESYTQKQNGTSNKTFTCPHCDNLVNESETAEFKDHIKLALEVIEEEVATLKTNYTQAKLAIEEHEKTKVELTTKLTTQKAELTKLDTQLATLRNELTALNTKATAYAQNQPTLNLDSKDILTLKELKNSLITDKNNAIANIQTELDKIDIEIAELQTSKIALNEIVSTESIKKNYLLKVTEKNTEIERLNAQWVLADEISKLIKDLQRDMFAKLNEKVEEKFGSNIQFRLFKINLDGSVDTRVCDMLVKDIHGTFIKLENINSGMYPVRAIEFITKVKEFYGLPKSFILIDEMYGLLDNAHKKMITQFGEQIIGNGYKEVEKIEIVKGDK